MSLTGWNPAPSRIWCAPLVRRTTPDPSRSSGLSRTPSLNAPASGQVIADSIQAIGSGGIVCLTGVGHGGVVTSDATRRYCGIRGVEEQRDCRQRQRQQAALVSGREFWPAPTGTWLSRLITRREKPENFKQALERKPDDIKVVIQFSEVVMEDRRRVSVIPWRLFCPSWSARRCWCWWACRWSS